MTDQYGRTTLDRKEQRTANKGFSAMLAERIYTDRHNAIQLQSGLNE